MAAAKEPAASPDAFENRTIIVSGGTGSLGRVICSSLAAAGGNVVVNDIDVEAVTQLVSTLVAAGHSAHGITLSATYGTRIVEETVAKFGRIDAVINATLGRIPWKPFEELDDDDFRGMFESTVLGPISIIRAAWPHFKAQKSGRVVNFTSDGLLGFPTGSTYTMTKGALFGVNRTLAAEGAPFNINVNCVSPIAYKPGMDRHLQNFSADVQKLFHDAYSPEGNVPMILALASDRCKVSGNVFNTAGMSVGRSVWGVTAGDINLDTMDACLEQVERLTEKNASKVFEPTSMADFTEFQAAWILGKEYKP